MTVLVVLLSIVIFAPKDRLFFLAEEKLEYNEVLISEEVVDNGLFGVDISNAHLSIKGVTMATIENIELSTLLLFSSVRLENVVLDDASKAMIPLSEFNLSLSHNLFAPKTLQLTLSYKEVEKEFQIEFLDEGMVRVEVEDINGTPWLKPLMQKDENGWSYEQSI